MGAPLPTPTRPTLQLAVPLINVVMKIIFVVFFKVIIFSNLGADLGLSLLVCINDSVCTAECFIV